jgi:hypothetical protein
LHLTNLIRIQAAAAGRSSAAEHGCRTAGAAGKSITDLQGLLRALIAFGNLKSLLKYFKNYKGFGSFLILSYRLRQPDSYPGLF